MSDLPTGPGPAARWRRLCERLAELAGKGSADPGWDDVLALEAEVLNARIGSSDDAIAALRVIAGSLREGPRSDGADAAALERVIAWLER